MVVVGLIDTETAWCFEAIRQIDQQVSLIRERFAFPVGPVSRIGVVG